MAEQESRGTGSAGSPEDSGLVLVPVPPDQAKAVMEFLASLQDDTDDVTGHTMSLSTFGSTSGRLGSSRRSATQDTVKNCKPTGAAGGDTVCDTDKWITP